MTGAPAPAAITVERRVEWSDTDAAGQHHFTSVLRWAEQAEFVLQERLGIAELVAGHCPRVHLSVDFKRPVYAREVVEIDLAVREVGAARRWPRGSSRPSSSTTGARRAGPTRSG
jgi:2-aminobenzoate-CoA ligase